MSRASTEPGSPIPPRRIPRGANGTSSTPEQPPARYLIIALVASVIVPLTVLAYSAWTLDHDLRRQAERHVLGELDVLTQHTLKVFQSADVVQDAMRLLTVGLTDAQIQTREPELHAAFRDLSDGLSSVQSVWLIDRNGRPLVSDLVSPVPPLDLADRDYFRALRTSDPGTYIGAVLKPKLAGRPFFAVGRRRVSTDGQFNGVITVSLLPTDIEHFYSQLDPDHAELYMMVRDDGAILTRFPEAVRPQSFLDPKTSPLLAALARNPKGGIYDAVSPVDGIKRVVGYRAIPGYPLVVLAGINIASIRATWRTTLMSHLAVGIPAILLLVITLCITIRRTQSLHREAQRRQSAEIALSRTQRLEAIGELTGGVAHDFNNLLMIIRGSAERLRRRAVDPRDSRSLDIIERTVQRGASLTRQLLTFASRQALAVDVIDLSQHLGKFADMLRRSLRQDIELALEVPPGSCVVKVDPGELELALLNIAVNARDAMPDGGRLIIRVHPVTLAGQPDTDGLSGVFVAVSVTDTGAGIPAQAMARVFEPFFTTKPTGKGTGLGLSQVYGFARQSGGTVTLASEVGRGTIVTMYLPATHEAPISAPVVHAAPPASGGGRRVLLVEDTADMAEVTRGLLLDAGYDVEVARAAREALDRLEGGARFDVVISDIIMPGEMKGIDLARELRDLHPGLPVVLISGYSASSDQAIREGFALMHKPFEVARLHRLIEDVMRRHQPAGRHPINVGAA